MLSDREEGRPPLPTLSVTFPMQMTRHFPLIHADVWRLGLGSGSWINGCWCKGSQNKSRTRTKASSLKWVEMMCAWCRQSLLFCCCCCCYGLTTLALIQGDTQPSNLLSAQFQWTMEFRARRYTILLSALRLAARLMRLRLPTGEPNGVKTKVLLWTNNPSLHYHTQTRWLLANTSALPRKSI